MDEMTRLVHERVCESLIYQYVRMVDFGEASRLADLFTEDGVWEAEGLTLEGREMIRAHFAKREAVVRRVSRHYCTNVDIEVTSDTQAQGLSYFMNFRHDRAEGDLSLPVPISLPKYSGEYHCSFARTDSGWQFRRLHVDVTFLRPPNTPQVATL